MYIDLAIISHPEADHFGGFAQLLQHYRIGAFLYNGRDAPEGASAWNELLASIGKRRIPMITVGQGDRIVHGSDTIDILSPDEGFARSGAANETGIVERIATPAWTALLTADIDGDVEHALLSAYGTDALAVDILKVAHHGSNTASGDAFLHALSPRIAVVEVAQNNPYHLPSKEILARIAALPSVKLFRTDQDGTITVWSSGDGLTVHEGP
jgi:competence protein ComEC